MITSNYAAGMMVTLSALAGIITVIFWMIVGWRAMRAHERLARAAEELAQKGPPSL